MPVDQTSLPLSVVAQEIETNQDTALAPPRDGDTWLHSLGSLRLYGELIRNLIHRDLKVKYGGSSVGVLLSLVDPVLMLLVYSFAGRYFLHIQKENFGLYLIPAVLTWSWFVGGLANCSRAVESQWYLLLNCHFPRMVLPIASLGSQFVTTIPCAVMLTLLFLPLGGHLWWGLLLSPLFLALQWTFVFGVVLAISALQVFYRDIASLTQVLAGLLFWLTPVVFDGQSIPPEVRPFLLCLNPMYSFISIQRQLSYFQALPEPGQVLAALLWTLAALTFGMALFLHLENRFCGEL